MEKINSKLNITLSDNGNMYLNIFAVKIKKTMTDKLQNVSYFSTEEAAEENAKFWREEMDYEVAFTMREIVFIE